jgi:hypothetical protein
MIRYGNTNLSREVDLNGLDANVLGTSSHGGGIEGYRRRRMRMRTRMRMRMRMFEKKKPEKAIDIRMKRSLCTRFYRVRSVTTYFFFFFFFPSGEICPFFLK